MRSIGEDYTCPSLYQASGAGESRYRAIRMRTFLRKRLLQDPVDMKIRFNYSQNEIFFNWHSLNISNFDPHYCFRFSHNSHETYAYLFINIDEITRLMFFE